MKADETLDTFGRICPMPIIMTEEKMREMKAGQVLEVLSDDDEIVSDMTDWCKKTGNALLEIEKDEKESFYKVYKVYVRKGPE